MKTEFLAAILIFTGISVAVAQNDDPTNRDPVKSGVHFKGLKFKTALIAQESAFELEFENRVLNPSETRAIPSDAQFGAVADTVKAFGKAIKTQRVEIQIVDLAWLVHLVETTRMQTDQRSRLLW